MSRPKKATVDYFPHSCNHKQTMFIVEQRFGNDGYAFWFKLLEMLGSAEGHYLDLNEPETMEFLQAKTRLDEDTCMEILELLVKLKAIDVALWGKRVVWSDNFIEGISRVYVNRRVELPKKPDNYTQKPEPVGISTQENPQSKVEYSKEEKKESIKKEKISTQQDKKTKEKFDFEKFWNLYPRRKGRISGKQECLDFIKQKIKPEEYRLLLKATANYAQSEDCKSGYARDPIRFLKKDYWRDWIDIKGIGQRILQKSLPKFDEDREFLCAECKTVKPKTEREGEYCRRCAEAKLQKQGEEFRQKWEGMKPAEQEKHLARLKALKIKPMDWMIIKGGR